MEWQYEPYAKDMSYVQTCVCIEKQRLKGSLSVLEHSLRLSRMQCSLDVDDTGSVTPRLVKTIIIIIIT